MSEEDDSEKEHEASARRLEQAREKGEIARSTDLLAAAAMAGFVLAASASAPTSLRQIGAISASLLDQSDRLSTIMLSGGVAVAGGLIADLLLAFAPLVVLPALAVLALLVAQQGLVFTPENLMPKLSRINPIANAKHKFGRNGLFEFAKSSVKLMLVALVLGWFLLSTFDEVLGAIHQDPGQAVAALLSLLLRFLFLVLAINTVFGGADYLWQYFEHQRRNRMSRKEMMDEHKESEGDPHSKAKRRSRGQEIALNRMLADVPKADVVIVNPTHYAVALKWDRAAGRAPVCVAKGVDEIAARIRERAAEAGVPIHRDPPTARALHASLDLGQEIRPEHYRAVAAAVRFAETMRRKARERR